MESVARIQGMLGPTRDLNLEAARDAAFSRKSSSRTPPINELKRLLDSRNEREVLDGLRHVIAASQQFNPNEPPLLFSAVLKNIASPNPSIKKLVYIHLLAHAEREPDTALLAINSVQKTLSAPDARLRALALRVMSGIRVPAIAQIVALAIKKGSGDMSPLVRKAAALAIPKCWRLDPSTSPQMTEYLGTLLGDRQYYVAGAAVCAFMECCPEKLDLVHRQYRALVRKLVDMDEWSQLATLRLLTIYARKCFPNRARSTAADTSRQDQDADTEDDKTAAFYSAQTSSQSQALNPDLTLLLQSALPLLHSRNSAVVVAATRLYLSLDQHPPHSSPYVPKLVGPLIALLRSPPPIAQTAILTIAQAAQIIPQHFARYISHLLIRSTDPTPVRLLKLETLAFIFPFSNSRGQAMILGELTHFARIPPNRKEDEDIIRASVSAIGRCAQPPSSSQTDTSNTSSQIDTPTIPARPETDASARCLRLLLSFARPSPGTPNSDPSQTLTSNALTTVRHLIQAAPSSHSDTVIRLAKRLDTTHSPAARASIVWLVGEFAGQTQDGTSPSGSADENNIAADVLRILTRSFAEESEVVKTQILGLASKVYVSYLNRVIPPPTTTAITTDAETHASSNDTTTEPTTDVTNSATGENSAFSQDHPIPKLYTHIHALIRYDTSYTLRDTARVHRALLPPLPAMPSAANIQLATLLLLAPKPAPKMVVPQKFDIGSASAALGPDVVGWEGVRGYEKLPEWVEGGREVDASVRDGGREGDGRAGVVGGREGGGGVISAASRLGNVEMPTGRAMGGGTGGKGKEKTLDDWLDESEEEEDEEKEEDDDDDDDEEEEESSEEETDDEEGESEEEEEESEDEDEHADERAKLVS